MRGTGHGEGKLARDTHILVFSLLVYLSLVASKEPYGVSDASGDFALSGSIGYRFRKRSDPIPLTSQVKDKQLLHQDLRNPIMKIEYYNINQLDQDQEYEFMRQIKLSD